MESLYKHLRGVNSAVEDFEVLLKKIKTQDKETWRKNVEAANVEKQKLESELKGVNGKVRSFTQIHVYRNSNPDVLLDRRGL